MINKVILELSRVGKVSQSTMYLRSPEAKRRIPRLKRSVQKVVKTGYCWCLTAQNDFQNFYSHDRVMATQSRRSCSLTADVELFAFGIFFECGQKFKIAS